MIHQDAQGAVGERETSEVRSDQRSGSRRSWGFLGGFLETTLVQVPAAVREDLEALVAARLAAIAEDV